MKKPVEGDVLLSNDNQMLYRSGMGKATHMMQYSRPDIYQAVQDLARHMGSATKLHLNAMFRMMKYISDTNERGLTLNPTWKWDGSKDHEFIINGRSDLDYAKDMQTRKSMFSYVVYLEGAPVIFKSLTQKSIALSVCNAEQTSGVLCVQDMLYTKTYLT